jgi:hypothetical protein
MGHTEMMLAVAGLDKNAITNLNQQLASGDWSSFRTEDLVAFAFARKQASNPAAVTRKDLQRLVDHLGAERAIDVVWWISRCHYMTTIADAFQLPLEKKNVFDGFLPEDGTTTRP